MTDDTTPPERDGQPRQSRASERGPRPVRGDGRRAPARPSVRVEYSRRQFLGASSAGLAGLTLGTTGVSAQVGNETPPLETDGRWIVDDEGEPVKLRGFATAGLDFVEEDFFPFDQSEVLARATDGETWHPNAIRLPITEWVVHEEGMDHVVSELLRPAVDQLAERGVYAVIDFHLIRPYVDAMGNAEGMLEDEWWPSLDDAGFDPEVPTDDLLLEFWSAVAPEFAEDDNVLYELFNEPTLPVWWADYGEYGDEVQSEEDAWLLWRDEAQPWVDEIREHAPETPIVVGSPHWTSRTRFAPEYPFEGENLIYAAHIYPRNGLPYEEHELPDGEVAEPFDDEYGAPAEEVPVVVTEFGWDPDEPDDGEAVGTTSGWGEPVREWLEEDYENMGWLAWCFDDSWAPTFFDSADPGASEEWVLKDEPEQMGGFVRDWLYETEADDDGDDHACADVEGAEDGEELADGRVVCDLDGDGNFRDVDASGDVTSQDLSEFFANQHRDPWDGRDDLFDYDDDGTVGQPDVVDLFEQL